MKTLRIPATPFDNPEILAETRIAGSFMQMMVRVEIHHANGEAYDRLHAAMAAEGITRTLTDERTGKKFHAPIGTYWTESHTDRWTALAAAQRAALPIDPKAEIMVSGEGRIVFFNCPDQPGFFESILGSTLLTSPTPAPSWVNLLVPPAKETSGLEALYSLMAQTK